MAGSRAQRVGIWVIAIVMAVGTIGSFLIIILSNQNQQLDQARKTELTNAYQKEYEAYQAKVTAQEADLAANSYGTFSTYASRVGAFDKDGVTELKKEDLVVGDGEDITADSTFYAFYIGWNPEGVVFDQSIDGDKLKNPIEVAPGGVITGWTEGLAGMKAGGVRELTIPADKAYGPTGSGDSIPPNTPLKFVVYAPKYEKLSAPQPSAELLKFYTTQ